MNSRTNAILTGLYSRASEKNVEGMERFGIKSRSNILGVPSEYIYKLAKNIGRDHMLAMDLWKSGIFEARILAAFIADPKLLTKKVMNEWVCDFDNWALCDGVCIHCFRYSPHAHGMVRVWIKRRPEYVRRAGFTLIATLAVNDKKSDDSRFLKYLPLIKKYSADERNFVKKAVNWALRQVGKRSLLLNRAAVRTADEIHELKSASAKWISSDALRELKSPAVQRRLRKKK
jgi:3-methyladenine DNA glycosylase AlkD